MSKCLVWTKQSPRVLEELSSNGRYFARRDRIANALGEESPFFLPAYDWLRKAAAKRLPPPKDADYPIWVSLFRESVMLHDKASIILEIEVDKSCILPIDIALWSKILNCAYLPRDEADLNHHKQMLNDYNTDDHRAFTTPFFPMIKTAILESWDRLFESEGDGRVGIIWEVKESWIKKIID